MGAMQPEFDDDEPINPFDFWEGANFKLKLKKVAGYWNYDSSEFARPSALLDGDDDELETLYNDLHDLQSFVAPTEFKSYEDLKKRLDDTWSQGTPHMQDQETVEEEQQWERERRGDFSESTAPAPTMPSADFNAPDITPSPSSSSDDDEDDALSYFPLRSLIPKSTFNYKKGPKNCPQIFALSGLGFFVGYLFLGYILSLPFH